MRTLRVIMVMSFVVNILSEYVVAELPRFRILAPQLICPKDKSSPIEKPDFTVITIQTKDDAEFDMDWTVRWQPIRSPTQRFTLIVWKTVRELETKLNGPQPEPFIYIINDDELLYGVNYIFNVTAKSINGDTAEPKSFYINNTHGQQTLEAIDGRTDSLSVILIGAQNTYTDIAYVLEAEVTTCEPMNDYYFIWKVFSADIKETFNISTIGSRLEIPSFSLQPGQIYDVTCYIIKANTDETITQTELPFEVGYRGLEVYLSADKLIVGIDHSFTVESTVINHDYAGLPLTFEWRCSINGAACDIFDDANESNLILSSGLPTSGQYEITAIVSVLHQFAEAKTTIIVLDSILPVIQVEPTPRVVNEGTSVTLVANVSNIMPICTLQWYFTTEEQLKSASVNDICKECQHGTPISDAITVFSLEENFLLELADFTNDTEWRQVTAELKANAGRARFITSCNCSEAFDCGNNEIAFADVYLKLNEAPKAENVTLHPSDGTALETIFRVSTHAARDPDSPLRYSFYCTIGNNTLMLGSYLEHFVVETFLPYVDGGTEIWVEVCDILGACSKSESITVHLLKGGGRTIKILMAETLAHIKRCEMILLQRVAIATLVTYNNAGQTEPLTVFTAFLLDSVPALSNCISQYDQYLEFLNNLALLGFDSGFV